MRRAVRLEAMWAVISTLEDVHMRPDGTGFEELTDAVCRGPPAAQDVRPEGHKAHTPPRKTIAGKISSVYGVGVMRAALKHYTALEDVRMTGHVPFREKFWR